MKKELQYLIICFLSSVVQVNAQSILQLYVDPPQPTSATPVNVIADLQFLSGDCVDKTLNIFQTGNRFEANSLHCLGLLTVICYDSDTFQLGLLAPGNYRFVLQVDAGYGFPPCVPGTAPGPVDSIDFVVTVAGGLQQPGTQSFKIFPNPGTTDFNIIFQGMNFKREIHIRDITGALVFLSPAVNSEMKLNAGMLSKGLYFIEVLENGHFSGREKLVIN